MATILAKDALGQFGWSVQIRVKREYTAEKLLPKRKRLRNGTK